MGTSDWEMTTLAKVSRKPISYGIVQTGEPVEGGIPCVRVLDLTDRELDPSKMITTTKEIHHAYRRTILERNEILFALRGEIGTVRLVPENLVGANTTRGVARISPDTTQVAPAYLLQYLQSPQAKEELRLRTNGSALQEVPIEQLRKLPIVLPPLPVQECVARVLGEWDRAVGLSADLLATKHDLLAGLKQQLLTGQRRFPEFVMVPWEERPISTFLTESRSPGSSGAVAKKLTIRLYGRGVRPKEDLRPGSAATQYHRRSAGQFIYSKLDFLNGAFGIIPDQLDGYESTLDLPAFDIADTVDPRWFLAFVTREAFYQGQVGLANGGRKARRVNPDDFLKICVRVPSLAEQHRIADTLEVADREITLLERQLDLLRDQKKGVMQQLLSGELRMRGGTARE